MTFEPPALNYDNDALERYIDEEAKRLLHNGDTRHPTATTSAATLIVWFKLRAPELSSEFERMMAGDRDVDLGSLDTMFDWRLMRPADVPGQSSEAPDYVLVAEIAGVDRWELQATEQVQRLADDLAHLVSARGMLVLDRVL
jgi:hypothetical protein